MPSSFVVEDGTGLPNANSYASVDFADSHFQSRGKGEWLLLTLEQKQAALIQATDYIDLRWGAWFKGERVACDQALEFPRTAFSDMPTTLLRATAEYAIRASNGSLAPDIQQDPSGYQVTRQFERVGPIEERKDFAFLGPGSSRRDLRSYPGADMYIRPLIEGSHGRVIKN